MLSQAQVKELFDYDSETGNLIWKSNHKANKVAGKIAGSKDSKGYRVIVFQKKHYKAHRLVWLWNYGFLPENDIDHINGDRYDNKIKNLREANRSENMQNMRKAQKNSKSGFLGVYKCGKKWKALIAPPKQKQICIGIYDTPELAHAAYIQKKRELHLFGTL